MEYYDHIAEGYDELHRKEQLKKLAIILSQVVALPEGPILDVGCGTGFSLDIIAKQLARACIGVEPSKGMMQQYRGEQQLLWGHAENLPFPNDFAALVVSVTAVQNFSVISKGVCEMARVAKPGAQVIVSCLKRSPKLEEVAAALAESLVVEKVIEEEKDIVFCCKRQV